MSVKDQILTNLKTNGFPAKKVSLPLEKMYEVADTKGENLNKILDELKLEGIDHDKTTDKIIFKSAMPNLGPDAFAKAQEMMRNMGSEEMQKLQEQVANMSEEEKQKMMEQAKAMGLF
tara:strand:+ start:1631 stop:1984 length:354 start_codon:yes stop_codon:yes gene_type:complete